MSSERILKLAFLADCRLPASVSWHTKLQFLLQDFLVPAPSQDDPESKIFLLTAAQAAKVQQLQGNSLLVCCHSLICQDSVN